MSDIAPAQQLDLLLQPGFRFHPTDHELVIHYLYRKVHGLHHHRAFIPEVHLYKHEPWELPGKSFSLSTHDPGAKVEWYLFAARGRKYPNGLRMERATLIGFWKSTGKDRPVMHNGAVVGMKKTLVFHIGRAPGGTRTDWVMHEYRLLGQLSHHIQDTYVLCRVFKKNTVPLSIDVPGGANTDEDLTQSVLGGIDTNKDPMEYMSGGTDLDNDPKQYVPSSVDSGKYMTPFVLGGVGTKNDPIQVEDESDVSRVGKDPMQSVLCSVGTDRDPLQVEPASNCVDADNGTMQSVLGDGVTNNDPKKVESESDGVDRGKGEKLLLTDRGDNKEKEGMQVGASADDNSGNDWYTTALEEEDNSWMQFPSYDLWYTGIDMGNIP